MTATGKPTGSNAGVSADPPSSSNSALCSKTRGHAIGGPTINANPCQPRDFKRAGLASDPAAQWTGTHKEGFDHVAQSPLRVQAVWKRFSSPQKLHATGAIDIDATV
jgi:hypothetical protein